MKEKIELIKIFLTCRNRFHLTRFCIQALYKFTHQPFQLYVYDNLTDYLVRDHWGFFCSLYEKGLITKYVANTRHSTFGCFSKAVAWNEFGHIHMMDPLWDTTDFLLCLDNDILVTDGWDLVVSSIWSSLKESEWYKYIHVVTQWYGSKLGQKNKTELNGYTCHLGTHTGSGFWAVKPTFFLDVGFLDITKFIGLNKKHDQFYWQMMLEKNQGLPYICGVEHMLFYNCGWWGTKSLCNTLTVCPDSDVSFSEEEDKLSQMTFSEFYSAVQEASEKLFFR